MSQNIILSRLEQKTHINYTAQDRIDGVITVYTDDPTEARKLESITGFREIGAELGVTPPGRVFQSRNHDISVSFRKRRIMSEKQRQKASKRMAELREKQLKGKGDD